YPEVRPLPSNPWTVLHAGAPLEVKAEGPPVVDLREADPVETRRVNRREADQSTVPAWHGTLLPAEDGDVWLATACADYERLVAQDRAARKRSPKGTELSADERERLSVALYRFRADYFLGARAAPEMALSKTKSDVRRDE